MANNIVLKTYKGGSVTPLDDAIIQQTVIATNGIFKGCNVTYARGNVLHISQGFGMIKGRFFEVYDCEVGVILNSGSGTLQGRLYIHMDLPSADEPIQLLTETASVLTDLTGDEDVNYNNTAYDLELATFGVTRTGITNLEATFEKITGASGSGGASTLQRSTEYFKGDFVTCKNAPGWVTLYCTTQGVTAATEPLDYLGIAEVGDKVTDGTCVFVARDVVGELDVLKDLFADTETSIAGLEGDIEDLRETLDLKAEEIQPVGAIKYSASASLGEEWLKCDGSFVSEDDYPELVAVLGKLTPGVDNYTELLESTISEQISNLCVVDGTVWVYLVKSKKLVGFSDSGKKEISVSGANELYESTTVDVVLSISGGALYLGQNGGAAASFILYECAVFDNAKNSISMVQLDVASKALTSSGKTEFANYCVPRVTTVRGMAFVVLGYSKPYSSGSSYSTSYYGGRVHYVSWTVGEFETTAQLSNSNEFRNYVGSGYATTTSTHMLHALSFSPKNDNDLVILCVYEYIYNSSNHGSNTIGSQVYSVSQGVFGSYDANTMLKIQGAAEKEQYMLFFDTICSGKILPMEKNTIPVAANGECLINVSIEEKHPVFYFARYNPQTILNKRSLTTVALPSRAKLFKESVCYASTQGLWFVFVGTGLMFGESVVDGSWGYLDTQPMIGAITRFACLDYNVQKNELCISGMDSTGIPRVWKLALPDLYSYASDGAWLPRLESDGVPAYIKAKTT